MTDIYKAFEKWGVECVWRGEDISAWIDSQLMMWVVFDMKDRSVNVLNNRLVVSFKELERVIRNQLNKGHANAIVFTSGKPESFIAGADINMLFQMTNAEEIEQLAKKGQEAFDAIESLPVPTIAAVNGPALGGGLELALACHWRVCSDSKKVQMGLPEVKIGVLPGTGGTYRLPRTVGLQDALPAVLSGSPFRPGKALKVGLVDRIFPSEERFPDEFRFWTAVRTFASSKMDTKPRIAVRTAPALRDRLLNGTFLGREIVARTAASNLDTQVRGQYPAPYYALECVLHGVTSNKNQALTMEAHSFAKLAVTPQAKALQSIFFMTEQIKKGSERVRAAPNPPPVMFVGVIGAGLMGSQIALLLINKRFTVYLRDIKQDIVDKGVAFIQAQLDKLVAKGRLTIQEKTKRLALLKSGTDVAGFKDCDMVIEAAVEVMSLKKRILKEIEEVCRDDCVFATNTSSLSITELASTAMRPQNVVGLHFFNPVNKMPLVEVIRGEASSINVVAAAYKVAVKLGKMPVICGDCPGFIVNRILGIYLNEAAHLLLEGNDIRLIDASLVKFGLPMGPFELMDLVGLDTGAHIAPVLEQGLGERYRRIPAYSQAMEENKEHLGKKTGSGFFLYDKTGKKTGVNPAVEELLRPHVLQGARRSVPAEMADRCVMLMINEAMYILDEKIVDAPEDIDLAMIMGTGFAPFRGGLLNYADQRGLRSVVDRLSEFEKTLASGRFRPHPKLVGMAAGGERFFPGRPDPRQLKELKSLPRSKL